MKSSAIEFSPTFGPSLPLPPPARRRGSDVKPKGDRKTGLFSSSTSMATVGIIYWGVFWGANGLDKFLNRTDFGPFVWYGKDRMAQFADYFTKLGLPTDLILPVLRFAGFWELIVALPFLGALILMSAKGCRSMLRAMLTAGFFLSGLTLITFGGFEVMAGDRAELREHALYLALLIVCCLTIRSTEPFGADNAGKVRNVP